MLYWLKGKDTLRRRTETSACGACWRFASLRLRERGAPRRAGVNLHVHLLWPHPYPLICPVCTSHTFSLIFLVDSMDLSSFLLGSDLSIHTHGGRSRALCSRSCGRTSRRWPEEEARRRPLGAGRDSGGQVRREGMRASPAAALN
jgi:hypothetical protein